MYFIHFGLTGGLVNLGEDTILQRPEKNHMLGGNGVHFVWIIESGVLSPKANMTKPNV